MATHELHVNISFTFSSDESKSESILELSSTATKIALLNFEWRYVTFVFFNSTSLFGVENFLQLFQKAVVVGKGSFYPNFVRTTHQYVLFENSVSDLEKTLKWMRDHEFDNTGKYVIVCQSTKLNDCDETEAMRVLWAYRVTNAIFLRSSRYSVVGFTYFPLNDSTCGYDNPVQLKNLGTCINAIETNTCNVFPKKLINLNACPLIASTFIQPPYMKIDNGKLRGSDGYLLNLISEKLNGSLKVMTPRIGNGWGKLEEDGTWSGSLADVYYDFANFSITSAAITLARFSYFQLSIAYNAASVVWVTHPAKKIPSSLKLLYPFKTDAQLALVISSILVVICAVVMRTKIWMKLSRIITLQRSRRSVVFYSWMICMGLPSTRIPTKTSWLYIVLLWIWYCLFIRTFYQVSLIKVLKSNYYFNEFATIDDAIDAKYPFGGGAALKDYYIDYPVVYDKWTNIETGNIIPTMRNVSYGLEFVLAMNMETAKTITWREKLYLHMLPQKVVTSPTVIFFKKYSPLVVSVNEILLKLIESGFTEKLYKNHSRWKLRIDTANTAEAIRIEHFKGCYAILIIGWMISFLLFVVEHIFYLVRRPLFDIIRKK